MGCGQSRPVQCWVGQTQKKRMCWWFGAHFALWFAYHHMQRDKILTTSQAFPVTGKYWSYGKPLTKATEGKIKPKANILKWSKPNQQ